MFGVDFVPPDGSAHAGGEGFPAESAFDPAPGFGRHERSCEQVNAGGCAGHIASARVGAGDAQGEVQGAAHAHRINARKVLTCGKNGGEVAPPGRNFGGGTVQHVGGRAQLVERKAFLGVFGLGSLCVGRGQFCRGGERTGGAQRRERVGGLLRLRNIRAL